MHDCIYVCVDRCILVGLVCEHGLDNQGFLAVTRGAYDLVTYSSNQLTRLSQRELSFSDIHSAISELQICLVHYDRRRRGLASVGDMQRQKSLEESPLCLDVLLSVHSM